MVRGAKEQRQTTTLGQLRTFYTGRLLPTLLKDHSNWTGKYNILPRACRWRDHPSQKSRTMLRSSPIHVVMEFGGLVFGEDARRAPRTRRRFASWEGAALRNPLPPGNVAR